MDIKACTIIRTCYKCTVDTLQSLGEQGEDVPVWQERACAAAAVWLAQVHGLGQCPLQDVPSVQIPGTFQQQTRGCCSGREGKQRDIRVLADPREEGRLWRSHSESLGEGELGRGW